MSASGNPIEGSNERLFHSTKLKTAERSLDECQAAMKASMDGIAIIGLDGRYTHVNEAFAEIYGYNRTEDLVGLSWKALYHESERKRFRQEVIPEFWQKGQWRGEVLGKKRDGTPLEQEVSLTIIKGRGLVSVVRDISKRKSAERVIWEEKERAQVTLQSIGEGVITTDDRGTVEYLNSVAEDLTGWNCFEATGLELSEVFVIVNEETCLSKNNPVERCLREGRVIKCTNSTVLVHRDGYRFAIESSAAPIRSRDGCIIGSILVFRDVSEKRRLLQEMAHQATHDSLTGLPNRILFNDRLNQSLAQVSQTGKLLAVMFMDLDRFKHVNDSLGHAAGDRLLVQVAERLRSVARQGDTVARFGGDQFSVLVNNIESEENAADVARRLISVIKMPFDCCDNQFHISASIGVAVCPADGKDGQTLMKHADTALYRAKEMGGGVFHLFTRTLNEKILNRIKLEKSLRQAIEHNEMKLYYQPRVDVETWQVTGVEALIRWNHPEKGIISPGEFVPLAEETGLIVPMGEWVLREACRQQKAWISQGIGPVNIAVNISARQFRQKTLLEQIKGIIAETGVDPGTFEFEITESAAMHDVAYTVGTLRELQNMGFGIVVDDFGTGHSSLNYLKQFPINALKIDRCFIQDILTDSKDRAIVLSIITLARNLNLRVIAEGVENRPQLNILRRQKCSEMQGYFISKPLPPEQLQSLFRRKKLPAQIFGTIFSPQPLGT